MGAEFSECHCRADGVRVTHRLLGTSYRENRTLSVSVFRGETLAFDGQHGPISSGTRIVGRSEPGVFTKLYLVTAADPSRLSVISPSPPDCVWDWFHPLYPRLECGRLF